MSRSTPPPGYYVPAVLFFDEQENFDVLAIKAHVLRLAEVNLLSATCSTALIIHCSGRSNRDTCSRLKWRGSTSVSSDLLLMVYMNELRVPVKSDLTTNGNKPSPSLVQPSMRMVTKMFLLLPVQVANRHGRRRNFASTQRKPGHLMRSSSPLQLGLRK